MVFGSNNDESIKITDEDKNEIERIQDHLDSDDTVLLVAQQSKFKPGGAILSGGNTIYATNKKIIIRNPTMLGLRESVEEITYDQITSVKLEKGMFSSTVVIRSSGLSELSRMSKSSGMIAWSRGEEGQIDAISKKKGVQLVHLIKEKMQHAKSSKNTSQALEEDPLKILKVRFAKGEISKEEYEENEIGIRIKPVIIIAIVFVLLIPIPVFAQDVYIQIDELPDWADYASNVMHLSTEAWKDANEGLEFYKVESGSDFTVKWVREFGGEYVGYAYGNQFIEVGLGDSNCGIQWNPYSERYISHIMKHEIGHIFGHEHDNDPDSIMYPVALNKEYGIVEEEYRLTEGYGQFIQFCTIKDFTSYEFSISTTDETYGFDYYIVPSSNEFVKWTEGKTFQHYSNSECFGENWLSISGTCKGVSTGSGIMILMDSELTSPLVTITVQQLEQPNIVNSKSFLTSKSITQEYAPLVFDTELQVSMLENQINDLQDEVISLEALVKQLEQENKQLQSLSVKELADQRLEEKKQEMGWYEEQAKLEENTKSNDESCFLFWCW